MPACVIPFEDREYSSIWPEYSSESLPGIFLDVQMHGLNGFEFLKELGTYNFEVVFVTAFDTYALRALKIAALDYLLKPIDIRELKDAVRKAGNRKMDFRHQLQLLQDQLGKNS